MLLEEEITIERNYLPYINYQRRGLSYIEKMLLSYRENFTKEEII
jgi:hypothetical protein